jgi:hypothetical protein
VTSGQTELLHETAGQDQVYEWRHRALRHAGYPEDQAQRLALRHDVDLHQAVELVRRGCPPGVAYRILS